MKLLSTQATDCSTHLPRYSKKQEAQRMMAPGGFTLTLKCCVSFRRQRSVYPTGSPGAMQYALHTWTQYYNVLLGGQCKELAVAALHLVCTENNKRVVVMLLETLTKSLGFATHWSTVLCFVRKE